MESVVMLEKRSGRRIKLIGVDGDKTRFCFIGEDKEKSMKTLMFDKLFRKLEENESAEQLTEKQLEEFKNVKTTSKQAAAKSAEEKREAAKKAREEDALKRREALTDPSIKLETEIAFSHRGNAAVMVKINDTFNYVSEITLAGKVAYGWLEKNGEKVTEFDNKGIKTVAPFIATELNVKPEALEFMLKEARATGIQNCKISQEEIDAKKAQIKAEKAPKEKAPKEKAEEANTDEAPKENENKKGKTKK